MTNCLKNPFGIRNGKIILVCDLTENERGLNCNCICPVCGCRYIAKLGTEKTPHFAHEKNALCDDELSIMTGLYRFIKESLETDGTFHYPGYYGKAPKPNLEHPHVKEAFMRSIQFRHCSSVKESPIDYDCIIQPSAITVNSVEIQCDTKNRPEAALLHYQYHNRLGTFAITLIPPKTVCRNLNPKPFKNYSTIALNVEDLEHMNSARLRNLIHRETNKKSWLSSQAIDNWKENKYKRFCQEFEKLKEKAAQAYICSNISGISENCLQGVLWNGKEYFPGDKIQHPSYGEGTILQIGVGNSVVLGVYHTVTAVFGANKCTFCLEQIY